ncbi:recombination regulator RecX [Clostridium sp. SYSU_GA19001]|uniref:recombination regulator RecX n=1 Tax=Clostridium caldaquaticum TaxID=2940653 RepID=UPI0020774FA6|nr:recombination regulator RecX [Clostridium caldaquaticum]MCM8711317.1 recombination regulator RecX [Clostridium caldaquaticum]
MERIITKVEIQKRNKDRVNVYIDGDFNFSCSAELAYTYSLKPGKIVELEVLKRIVNEDSYLKCKNQALKIIEKNYKSEKEVFDKLKLKGYDEKTIAKVIEFLISYNFLNDECYAAMYINNKINSQGRNKIKQALLRKGIDEVLINEKLKKLDNNVELQSAFRLGERKYKILQKTERDKRKIAKKLWEYFTRNGYSFEIINEVLNKLITLEHDEQVKVEKETNFEELYELACKRYNIVSNSEKDEKKLYKKLSDFLLRRGYPWEDIKKVLTIILKSDDFIEEY